MSRPRVPGWKVDRPPAKTGFPMTIDSLPPPIEPPLRDEVMAIVQRIAPGELETRRQESSR